MGGGPRHDLLRMQEGEPDLASLDQEGPEVMGMENRGAGCAEMGSLHTSLAFILLLAFARLLQF